MEFLASILNASGDLLNIMGMVGIAFLTVLIPIALAIFGDKKEFEDLDRNVILDHVVKSRKFIGFIALVYTPLLLWGSSNVVFRTAYLVLWAIGIAQLGGILGRAYRWMKDNKYPLRLEYLELLDNPEDLEVAWRSVWETENIEPQHEEEFFALFSSLIDNYLQNYE